MKKIFCVILMLVGILGAVALVFLLTYKIRTGDTAGMGLIFAPLYLMMTLLLPAGIGIFFNKGWLWKSAVVLLVLLIVVLVVQNMIGSNKMQEVMKLEQEQFEKQQ